MKGFEYNRDDVQALLESFGMREENALHYAGILCKWDSFNFCPDCEVRSYLKFFRILLDTPHERRWSGFSYSACFYMWQELSKIWDFRRSLSLRERWAWKRPV